MVAELLLQSCGNFCEITDLGCCCRLPWLLQQLQLAKLLGLLGRLAALATLYAAIRLALAAGPQNFELLRRRLRTCAGFQFVVVIKGRTWTDPANNVYKHSCCCSCCRSCGRCISETATVACANRATFTSSKGWRHSFSLFFCASRIVYSFWANAKICGPDIHVCDMLNPPKLVRSTLVKELAYEKYQTSNGPSCHSCSCKIVWQ